MVEEKQHAGGGRRGEKRINRLGYPSPNPPRLSPCKRNPAMSSSSSSFHRLLKKTRYASDLLLCHSCGLRFPSNSNNNNPLDHLRSQWRVALLCRTCLARVKSAPIASPPSLTPNVPSLAKPGIGSRVSLEVVVREASSVAEKKIEAATRARENALKKADAAKRAAERARNALGAVLAPKGEILGLNADLTVVTDQELALQLHLAMNGSRRISRSSSGSLSSGAVGSIDVKKVCGRGGDQICRNVDSGDHGICKAAVICAEDNSFLDVAARTVFGQGSDVDLESSRNQQRKLIDDNGKDGPAVVPPKQDQGNSSDKIVSSDADIYSTDSVSLDYEKKNVSDGVLFPLTCRSWTSGQKEAASRSTRHLPPSTFVRVPLSNNDHHRLSHHMSPLLEVSFKRRQPNSQSCICFHGDKPTKLPNHNAIQKCKRLPSLAIECPL
ncbi:hypothetical protein OPV22_016355 [Ensete ventricosum]|uniref:C2H2-type domain-containing protein n=1 Tax=Ensete ventricosum TaxID=4639 RepID=A0AAV8QX78_ENSVE|nr:hypothetical protein OPV22_016355 [Ensete ventricosum]